MKTLNKHLLNNGPHQHQITCYYIIKLTENFAEFTIFCQMTFIQGALVTLCLRKDQTGVNVADSEDLWNICTKGIFK